MSESEKTLEKEQIKKSASGRVEEWGRERIGESEWEGVNNGMSENL